MNALVDRLDQHRVARKQQGAGGEIDAVLAAAGDADLVGGDRQLALATQHQSELVTGAANAVRDAILGAVLAGVVLFRFLGSWRLMIITAALLPAVLAATCLALYVLGMSFNMVALGGMAAAVGLVV